MDDRELFRLEVETYSDEEIEVLNSMELPAHISDTTCKIQLDEYCEKLSNLKAYFVKDEILGEKLTSAKLRRFFKNRLYISDKYDSVYIAGNLVLNAGDIRYIFPMRYLIKLPEREGLDDFARTIQ